MTFFSRSYSSLSEAQKELDTVLLKINDIITKKTTDV